MEVDVKSEPLQEVFFEQDHEEFECGEQIEQPSFYPLGHSDNDEMRLLLQEWGLEVLTERFAKNLIDVGILDYVVDIDIVDICKGLPMRYRIILRQKLKNKCYKRKPLYSNVMTTIHSQLSDAPEDIAPKISTFEETNTESLPFGDVTLRPPHGNKDRVEAASTGRASLLSINNKGNHSVTLEDIAANQALLINNMAKVMNSIGQLKASMDYLKERLLQIKPTHRESISTVDSEEFFKPVESVEMMNDLERALQDDSVMSKYLKSMSQICGTTGKEEGIDCCYRLIDYFMTRRFLTNCSWTGVSRDTVAHEESNGESEPYMKVSMLAYKNIRQLFLKLVIQADSSFTTMKCDEFFKRVLKNSKQRLMAKSISKHKKRPRHLHYNSRQQNGEQHSQ